MAMPNELVFVRHGQSEANIVQKMSKNGQAHPSEPEINDRPDWKQRLSEKGIEQAKIAGAWIQKELGGVATFDALYVSPFLRTRETAAYIAGESDAKWTVDDRLIERSWGSFGASSYEERRTHFAKTLQMQEASPWFTRLDGGESFPDVSGRFRDMQATLHREQAGKRTMIVSHGDFINAARYNIERMLPEQWEAMDAQDEYTIRNCTVLTYSRVNPENADDIREKLHWRRMVYPDAMVESPDNAEWIELPIRQRFTGAELLRQTGIAHPILRGDA